jgi:hypothetical protein
MSEQTYPMTMVKGDQARTVRNVREAVKAKFDGFKTVEAIAASDHPVRSEIQAAAKAAGVPANKSTDEIVEALVKTDVDTHEEGARPEAQVADEGDPQPTTPDTLDQDPAPAAPDTEGAKGSTEAPKPTAPGKSSTRTTR